ncbi:MAG: four helix bundle protein [Candidatus Brocadiales bacterium]|nr:four helix bundle protein [Candidatus Brocadiales bacterium]
MKIERFEDIEARRLARELTRKVYSLTKKLEFAKDYGLKRQIQEASGSSMHNIAEGFDSETNAEFIRFLRYAKRSCTEVQSELYVALDEEYISSANSKKSMIKREEPVQPYVDLSTILRNTKKVKQPTVNFEL